MEEYVEDCDLEGTINTLLLLLLLLPVVWYVFDFTYVIRLTYTYIAGSLGALVTQHALLEARVTSGLWCARGIGGSMLLGGLARDCCLARLHLWLGNGVWAALGRKGVAMTTGGHVIRLIEPLHFLQRYSITSKVACWDEDSLYVEHVIERRADRVVCVVLVAREKLTGLSPNDLVLEVCGRHVTSPHPPGLVSRWLEGPGPAKAELNPYCYLKHRTLVPQKLTHTHTHKIYIHLHRPTLTDSHSTCTNIEIEASSASVQSHTHCTHIEIPSTSDEECDCKKCE